MTYSTAAGRPFQLSIGVFDPASNAPYTSIELPRLEAEGVYSSGNTKLWFGGLVQNNGTGGAGGRERYVLGRQRRHSLRRLLLLIDGQRLLRQGPRHHPAVH